MLGANLQFVVANWSAECWGAAITCGTRWASREAPGWRRWRGRGRPGGAGGAGPRPMRTKLADLERALSGRLGPQFLLREQLTLVDNLDGAIERVNSEVARRLQPQVDLVGRLDAIPGVGQRTA